MLNWILRKFLVKEIKSKKEVLHFRRYLLLNALWFSVYIHRIYRKDEDLHPHNHAFDFISFILKGAYYEEIEGKVYLRESFSCKKYDTNTYHKLVKLKDDKCVTTLVIVWNRNENYKWGYMVAGKHVNFDNYRKIKNENKLINL